MTLLKSRLALCKDRSLWICCGLVAATVAAYWPVGSADFVVFDDEHYVYENPHVLHGLSWDSVTWALTTGQQANWHPLTWWSLMLDVQLFGPSSRAMHLVNLALHVGSSIVLFLALRRMTGAVWRSGMVAALFALHPLHVESVAWVAERKDVLSTFLGMLALWAYAKAGSGERGAGSGQWAVAWYAAVVVLFALGLMAKPMLVTLPFVLLLLDYWPLGRFQPAVEAWSAWAAARRAAPAAAPAAGGTTSGKRPKQGRVRWKRMRMNSLRWTALSGLLRPVIEKLPLLALTAASCWITYRMAASGGAMAATEHLSLPERVANAGVAYVLYIVKMLWPANLSVFYPLAERPILAAGIASWMLLAGISVAVLMAAQRGRTYVLVGWLWYLGTLVPAIGLVQVGEQSMADRYSYVPLIGLFLAAVWGAADLTSGWRRQRLWLGAAAGGILLACGLLTAGETRVWVNTETLFTQAIRVQADNWHAQRILAYWWWRQGHYETALEGWQNSLRYHPNDPDVWYDLGVATAEHGEKEKAIAAFFEVVRLRPERADAHGQLAVLLTERGAIGPALEQWQAVLKKAPFDMVARNAVAWIFATCPDARFRRGDAAVSFALKAAQVSQNGNPAVLDTLAAAYAEAGRFDKAVETAQRALGLAGQQGDKKLEASLQTRLKSYQARKPWRDPRLQPAKNG